MVWFQPLLPGNSSDLRHDANSSCKPPPGPGAGGTQSASNGQGAGFLVRPLECVCVCSIHSIQYFNS